MGAVEDENARAAPKELEIKGIMANLPSPDT